jgi:glycerophosphoryl diester phosphodiesterase
MSKAAAAAVMYAGVVMVSSCSAGASSGADMKTKHVEYVAHRGASYAAPENTLAAVELAWKAEEVIATIPEGRRLYVELKSDKRLVPALAKMLEGNAHRKQIVFIGFNLNTISACKERMADIPAYWLAGGEKDKITQAYIPIDPAVIQTAKEKKLDGLDLHFAVVTAELADKIRAAGLELAAWTVNKPTEAKRLIELGAVSITTDRPDCGKQETEKLLEKN